MSKLDKFKAAGSRAEANRLLLTWLSDDDDRADLYDCLSGNGGVLKFQSRADIRQRPNDDRDSVFHQNVYLVGARKLVEEVLKDPGTYSSCPYKALSTTFMLGLDDREYDEKQKGTNDDRHQAQRTFADTCLKVDPSIVDALAVTAFEAAAVLPLKQPNFDLAELAEQAALRFAGALFGFAQVDHALLEAVMRYAYRALCYQIIGRHFVTEPETILAAELAMADLLGRTAHLIDLYRYRIGQEQEDEYQRIGRELEELRQLKAPLRGFEPIMRRLARPVQATQEYSGTELAVIVVGLIAGTVGNVQASVCIAINKFFRGKPSDLNDACAAARKSCLGVEDADARLNISIREALRLNPPAAFLPRMKRTTADAPLGAEQIPKGSVLLLGMGAATREGSELSDTLVFGGPPDGAYPHQCVGRHLATPVISRVVRGILVLDGLAERADPRTGKTLPLQKRWGIMCHEYPLQFNRESWLTQSPLLLVMDVKTPTAEHAEELKAILKYGAPTIEKKLNDAQHVHFAWFTLIDNDTKLMLSTVYDRKLAPYIEYFALQTGPLFDLIFEHLEDAPPRPVAEFPKEFIDTIRRHNRSPAAGYFYSAYPKPDVPMITRQFEPPMRCGIRPASQDKT